jgi:V/A-type H+/Na+-transporting ATPase subunit G/H
MTNSSSSSSQEEYIDSLRQIKETEEKVQVEIETFRKNAEQEIKNLQKDLKNAIDMTKQEGKKLVEKSIEESKNTAFVESDKIISDAKNKSKSISFKLDGQMKQQIMDIIFSGM